jgi:hypothetical protein
LAARVVGRTALHDLDLYTATEPHIEWSALAMCESGFGDRHRVERHFALAELTPDRVTALISDTITEIRDLIAHRAPRPLAEAPTKAI